MVLGALLLFGCAVSPELQPCMSGAIRLSLDAPGAPASPCTRQGETSFELDILPEAEPINPSPWYAFVLESETGGEASVTLDYAVAGHRYAPWVSEDGRGWTRLDPAAVTITPDGGEVRFDLELEPGRLLVAAQPLYTLADYDALTERWPGDWRTIATSPDGRPIRALVAPPREPEAGWILLLGRQHPPEITGAWAFEAFAGEMLDRRAAGALSAGLIVIPLLNPDGVDRGHWRLNAAGVDLNRDWAARTQPETRAVFGLLDALGVTPGELALMVDFHSTIADRLYLPRPEELPPGQAERLDTWLRAMERDGLFSASEPIRTNPERRVSAKAVFTDLYAVPALTWEAGDNTPEAEVREMARRGAGLWVDVRREGNGPP